MTDLNELLEAETAPDSAEKRDSYSQAYESCPELPDDLTPIDDVFLGRIRALASLI